MSKLKVNLDLLQYNSIVEDLNTPLSLYSEMASISGKTTGLALGQKQFPLILVPTNNRHNSRIKISIHPNTTKPDYHISIFKKIINNNEFMYIIVCPSRLKGDIQQYIEIVEMAILLYENNNELINSFIEEMTNGNYPIVDDLIKSLIPVDLDDLKSFNIKYEIRYC